MSERRDDPRDGEAILPGRDGGATRDEGVTSLHLTPESAGASWRAVADNPNHADALGYRDTQLRRATWSSVPDRESFLVALCTGRRVLDLGCLGHDAVRAAIPSALHRRLCEVAAACTGCDYLPEAVAAVQAAGFNVVVADVERHPPNGLVERAPFDVVVAGEVIEHLRAPQALLEFARPLMAPDGVLVVTTPNPYAPWRTRAGLARQTWENVDHVVYVFPSGMAEMADRAGLCLEQIVVVQPSRWRDEIRRSIVRMAVALVRRARGRRSRAPSGLLDLPLPARYVPLSALIWSGRQFSLMGETCIYLLRRR